MNLDELHDEWDKDTDIDPSMLTEEARKIPKLHSKYYRYYNNQFNIKKRMETDLKRLFILRTDWYNGELAEEDLKELGWEPCLRRIPKSFIKDMLDGDPIIIKMKLKLGNQEAIVEFLENIIKSINNRGYLIKTILDFEKFRSGAI